MKKIGIFIIIALLLVLLSLLFTSCSKSTTLTITKMDTIYVNKVDTLPSYRIYLSVPTVSIYNPTHPTLAISMDIEYYNINIGNIVKETPDSLINLQENYVVLRYPAYHMDSISISIPVALKNAAFASWIRKIN